MHRLVFKALLWALGTTAVAVADSTCGPHVLVIDQKTFMCFEVNPATVENKCGLPSGQPTTQVLEPQGTAISDTYAAHHVAWHSRSFASNFLTCAMFASYLCRVVTAVQAARIAAVIATIAAAYWPTITPALIATIAPALVAAVAAHGTAVVAAHIAAQRSAVHAAIWTAVATAHVATDLTAIHAACRAAIWTAVAPAHASAFVAPIAASGCTTVVSA